MDPPTVESSSMVENSSSVDRNDLSVLVAIALLGNVLFRFIQLPEQRWRYHVLGSPLEIHVTGIHLLVVWTIALVCTGANVILHRHTSDKGRPTYISWILPGTFAGLATYALSRVSFLLPAWLVGLGLMGVGLAATISAECRAASPESRAYPLARLALNVLAYLLAFVMFAVIFQSRSRSLVSATFTLLTAVLLSLDLLSVVDVPIERVLLFAGIVGLVVGESTWALNYWLINGWIGGVLLLLVFYVVTNLSYQHLLGRLTILSLLEFGGVALAVFVIVLLVSR